MANRSFPLYKCYPEESPDSQDPNYVFPSSNKEAIIDALSNLQDKIQRLDKERLEALSHLHNLTSQNQLRSDRRDGLSTTIIKSAETPSKNGTSSFSKKPFLGGKERDGSSMRTLNTFHSDDVLNSTKIDKGKKRCSFGTNKFRRDSELSGETLPLDQNEDTTLPYVTKNLGHSKLTDKMAKNSDKISSAFGRKLNQSLSLKKYQSYCSDRYNGKQFTVLDGIYNRAMQSDDFVTLPESSSKDISKRLENAETRCNILQTQFKELNNSINVNLDSNGSFQLDKLALRKTESNYHKHSLSRHIDAINQHRLSTNHGKAPMNNREDSSHHKNASSHRSDSRNGRRNSANHYDDGINQRKDSSSHGEHSFPRGRNSLNRHVAPSDQQSRKARNSPGKTRVAPSSSSSASDTDFNYKKHYCRHCGSKDKRNLKKNIIEASNTDHCTDSLASDDDASDDEDDEEEDSIASSVTKLESVITDLESEITNLYCQRDRLIKTNELNQQKLTRHVESIKQKIELKIFEVRIIKKYINGLFKPFNNDCNYVANRNNNCNKKMGHNDDGGDVTDIKHDDEN